MFMTLFEIQIRVMVVKLSFYGVSVFVEQEPGCLVVRKEHPRAGITRSSISVCM